MCYGSHDLADSLKCINVQNPWLNPKVISGFRVSGISMQANLDFLDPRNPRHKSLAPPLASVHVTFSMT
jgi:hypothetical protein